MFFVWFYLVFAFALIGLGFFVEIDPVYYTGALVLAGIERISFEMKQSPSIVVHMEKDK